MDREDGFLAASQPGAMTQLCAALVERKRVAGRTAVSHFICALAHCESRCHREAGVNISRMPKA